MTKVGWWGKREEERRGGEEGLHVLCISETLGGGRAEWSTFPVHKVNVSDSRQIERH